VTHARRTVEHDRAALIAAVVAALAEVTPPLRMRVGVLNALIDLVDGPSDQVGRLITMPALVRLRHP
jgi:hypothetical protein